MSVVRGVELYCKQEGLVVGTFAADGVLSAKAVSRPVERDVSRYPTDARDRVQLLCRACLSPLYFRDAQGTEIPAIPGVSEVCEDLEELARRERAANEALKQEAERERA